MGMAYFGVLWVFWIEPKKRVIYGVTSICDLAIHTAPNIYLIEG
jgi:hypothetical protein